MELITGGRHLGQIEKKAGTSRPQKVVFRSFSFEWALQAGVPCSPRFFHGLNGGYTWGGSINRWFKRANPIKMDDDWGYPYFWNPHMVTALLTGYR